MSQYRLGLLGFFFINPAPVPTVLTPFDPGSAWPIRGLSSVSPSFCPSESSPASSPSYSRDTLEEGAEDTVGAVRDSFTRSSSSAVAVAAPTLREIVEYSSERDTFM